MDISATTKPGKGVKGLLAALNNDNLSTIDAKMVTALNRPNIRISEQDFHKIVTNGLTESAVYLLSNPERFDTLYSHKMTETRYSSQAKKRSSSQQAAKAFTSILQSPTDPGRLLTIFFALPELRFNKESIVSAAVSICSEDRPLPDRIKAIDILITAIHDNDYTLTSDLKLRTLSAVHKQSVEEELLTRLLDNGFHFPGMEAYLAVIPDFAQGPFSALATQPLNFSQHIDRVGTPIDFFVRHYMHKLNVNSGGKVNQSRSINARHLSVWRSIIKHQVNPKTLNDIYVAHPDEAHYFSALFRTGANGVDEQFIEEFFNSKLYLPIFAQSKLSPIKAFIRHNFTYATSNDTFKGWLKYQYGLTAEGDDPEHFDRAGIHSLLLADSRSPNDYGIQSLHSCLVNAGIITDKMTGTVKTKIRKALMSSPIFELDKQAPIIRPDNIQYFAMNNAATPLMRHLIKEGHDIERPVEHAPISVVEYEHPYLNNYSSENYPTVHQTMVKRGPSHSTSLLDGLASCMVQFKEAYEDNQKKPIADTFHYGKMLNLLILESASIPLATLTAMTDAGHAFFSLLPDQLTLGDDEVMTAMITSMITSPTWSSDASHLRSLRTMEIQNRYRAMSHYFTMANEHQFDFHDLEPSLKKQLDDFIDNAPPDIAAKLVKAISQTSEMRRQSRRGMRL